MPCGNDGSESEESSGDCEECGDGEEECAGADRTSAMVAQSVHAEACVIEIPCAMIAEASSVDGSCRNC